MRPLAVPGWLVPLAVPGWLVPLSGAGHMRPLAIPGWLVPLSGAGHMVNVVSPAIGVLPLLPTVRQPGSAPAAAPRHYHLQNITK